MVMSSTARPAGQAATEVVTVPAVVTAGVAGKAARDVIRYRAKVVRSKTSEVQRLGNVLQDAGIKTGSVASSIVTRSGRAMIESLTGGERRPEVLAELAIGRMRPKIPDLARARRPGDHLACPGHRNALRRARRGLLHPPRRPRARNPAPHRETRGPRPPGHPGRSRLPLPASPAHHPQPTHSSSLTAWRAGSRCARRARGRACPCGISSTRPGQDRQGMPCP
jgi:hypothetical protein